MTGPASERIPAVLTIAATHASGVSGLSADVAALSLVGARVALAVTAVTARLGAGVREMAELHPDMVVGQIDAALEVDIGATKTGFLATLDVADVVADLAESGRLPGLVVDPVLVDRNDHPLGDSAWVEMYRDRLLPHASVATPNRPEAELLVGRRLPDLAAVADAAVELRGLGAGSVVITGGRDAGDAVDVLAAAGRDAVSLTGERLALADPRGTGDRFSAVVAFGLASGADVAAAAAEAKRHVRHWIDSMR